MERCSICDGTGIEYKNVEIPDGFGGQNVIEEPRPCSECQ